MPNRKISAKELLGDIHAGLDYPALMEKYGITFQTLDEFLGELLDAKLLEPAEAHRVLNPPDNPPDSAPSPPIEIEPSPSNTAVAPAWKCPACGKPQTREFEVCPKCGVIVSKYTQIESRPKKICPQCHFLQRQEYTACPECGFDWIPYEKEMAAAQEHQLFIERCIYEGIPIIACPSLTALQVGEEPYHYSSVEVYRQKTQTKNYRSYLGTRVKIGKMPLYWGFSSPHPVSQEVMELVGSGNLLITNKRIVLSGSKINCSIKLEKINGSQVFSDSVQIFNEGATGGRIYKVPDPQQAGTILAVLLKRGEFPGWMFAVNDGRTDVMERFLRHGLDVNVRSKEGFTPLCIASEKGNVEIARCLLDHGANVNFRMRGKMTPLMVAASQGNKATVDLFIERGADRTAKDATGLTAADYAANHGHSDVETLLR